MKEEPAAARFAIHATPNLQGLARDLAGVVGRFGLSVVDLESLSDRDVLLLVVDELVPAGEYGVATARAGRVGARIWGWRRGMLRAEPDYLTPFGEEAEVLEGLRRRLEAGDHRGVFPGIEWRRLSTSSRLAFAVARHHASGGLVEPRHLVAGLWSKASGRTRTRFDEAGVGVEALARELGLGGPLNVLERDLEPREGFPAVAPATSEVLRGLAKGPAGEGQIAEAMVFEALLASDEPPMPRLRELVGAAPATALPTWLFTRGKCRVEWVLTPEPWKLDVEAVALPVDGAFGTSTGVVRAWIDAQGPELSTLIDDAVAKAVGEGPDVLTIPIDRPDPKATPQRLVLLASAFAPAGSKARDATLAGASGAAAAVVREASSYSVASVALPLFGSGYGALDPAAVAHEIVGELDGTAAEIAVGRIVLFGLDAGAGDTALDRALYLDLEPTFREHVDTAHGIGPADEPLGVDALVAAALLAKPELAARLGAKPPERGSSDAAPQPPDFDPFARTVLVRAREGPGLGEPRALTADAVLAALASLHAEGEHAGELGRVGPLLSEIEEEVYGAVGPNRAIIAGDRVGFARSGGAPTPDHLSFGPQVNRFATLLAARGDGSEKGDGAEVGQSVAIGLFGNWGSGKSTFMRLLAERVDELSERADDDGNTAHRVAQIDFNAWHYADANLWASIATRLFDRLAEEIQPSESAAATVRRELRERLESSQSARGEAEARRREAIDARDKAQRRLEWRQKIGERRRRSLGARLLARLVEGGDGRERTLARVRSVAESVGVAHGIETADELASTADALREELTGWHAVGKQLLHLCGSTPLRVVATAVVLVGAAWALGRDWGAAGGETEWLAKATGALSVALPTLGALRGRLSAAAASAQELCNELQELAVSAERDEGVRTIQNKIARQEARIEQAEADIASAEGELRSAEQELARIRSGGLVYDFLADPERRRTYREQLGLISFVRRDFEKLGELLEDWSADGERPIERIVLYIDDLDRCEPERVVEVLQAVHLLFDFPLFSVVVGVDPRWLERSLLERYGREDSDGRDDVFDPQNYLEKIFQIPYSIERMGAGGFARLVEGLAPARREEPTRQKRAELEAELGHPAGTEKNDPTDLVDLDVRRSVETSLEDARQDKEQEAEGGLGPDARGSERREEARKRQEAELQRRRYAALHLSKEEHGFAKRLYPFVRTPREGKRMLNVYRLLRVHAAESQGTDFAAFERTEHRAALLLLALQIGHGEFGAALLRELARWYERTLANERPVGTEALPVRTFSAFIEELASLLPGVTVPEAVADELGRLANDENWLDDLEPYLRWAGEVGRYSFGWHLWKEPGSASTPAPPPPARR